MINFEDTEIFLDPNDPSTYVSQGCYGVVLKGKIKKTSFSKILKATRKPIIKDFALKINLKEKDEKVIGISCLKELSIFITLNFCSYDDFFTKENSKEEEEGCIVKILDYIEDSKIKNITDYYIVNSNNNYNIKNKSIDKIHFLFEFMDHDLYSYLNKTFSNEKFIPEEIIKSFFEDIYFSFFWCKINKIIHRDIKMQNILIKDNGNKQKKITKICDFGLSCYVKDINKNLTKTPGVISKAYRAPEVTSKLEYDYKIDYWGFGLILLQMMINNINFNFPFVKNNSSSSSDIFVSDENIEKNQQTINKTIEKCKNKLKSKNYYTQEFLDNIFKIIENLLVINKNKRFNLKQIEKIYKFFSKNFDERKKLLKTQKEEKNELLEEQFKILNFSTLNEFSFLNENYKILKKKMLSVCFYLETNSYKNSWFKTEILYHSNNALDLICNYFFNHQIRNENYVVDNKKVKDNNNSSKKCLKEFFNIFNVEDETRVNSLSNNKPNEKYLDLFILCIFYTFFKFFTTFSYFDWSIFIENFPKNYFSKYKKLNKNLISYIEEIELWIVSNVFGYQIYTITSYEDYVSTNNSTIILDDKMINNFKNIYISDNGFKFPKELNLFQKYLIKSYNMIF